MWGICWWRFRGASMLRLATALIQNDQGHILLVRKHGTTAFMQPGGKIDPGESVEAALVKGA